MKIATIDRIATTLIPDPLCPQFALGRVEYFPLFSTEELETSDFPLKSNNAPGPDWIPGVAIKKVFSINSRLLLKMHNACRSKGAFSCLWKMAMRALISKEKGSLNCRFPTGLSVCWTLRVKLLRIDSLAAESFHGSCLGYVPPKVRLQKGSITN